MQLNVRTSLWDAKEMRLAFGTIQRQEQIRGNPVLKRLSFLAEVERVSDISFFRWWETSGNEDLNKLLVIINWPCYMTIVDAT